MKKTLLFFALLLVGVQIAAAQIRVNGKVTSAEDGEAVIGATVALKGTNNAVLTDVNGAYTITIATNANPKILEFSFTGMVTKEMTVTQSGTVNVTLEPDVTNLEAVVVTTGYTTSTRGNYTGAAAVVSKTAIENTQTSSVSRALQGLASGVQANAASGQPGTDADIRIRGIGSINASSSPLYVVDGVPYEGALNSINPADIESISVLKDAASGALYGSRGANGVIVITTKQGSREASPAVSVNFTHGVSQRAVKDYSKVNTVQYAEMYWEAIRNYQLTQGKNAQQAAEFASANVVPGFGINPFGTKYAQPVGLDGKVVSGATVLWDDDWVDALSQPAYRTELQASVSGGSRNSSYFLSAGYLDDQGIALMSGFKRYTGRMNLQTDVKPWLTLGASVSITNSTQDYPKSDDTATSNVINTGRRMPNFYPVYERNRETGDYILDGKGEKIIDWGTYRPSAAQTNQNLVGSMPYDKNEIKRDAASIRAFGEVKFTDYLRFKSTFNVDYNSRTDHYYTNPVYGPSKNYKGDVSKNNNRTLSKTISNILTFNKTLDNQTIRVLVGQEYYDYNVSSQGGSRRGFGMLGFIEPSAASEVTGFSGSADNYRLLSFLGNAEYSYANKYFLSASIRTDGSSRFSPENRWGTFWSFGASWRAIREDFLKDVSWLSNATLRASYGAQGNDGLSTYYAYQELYSIYNNLNTGESGMYATRLGTPGLKWESNLNLNIGLDMGFWSNRLTGTIEFFNRASKDLLFPMPMPNSSGFTSIDRNIGAMSNTGWELQVTGTPVKTQDWSWTLSFNTTSFKNRIDSQPQEVIWSGSQKRVVGGSLYDFYMVEWAGVNPENGKARWWQIDEKTNERSMTEIYPTNNASKVFSGSALPNFVGGLSTTLTFRNWEFYAMLTYSLGGKIYNSDKLANLHQGNNVGVAWSSEMLDRWTPENKNSDIPALSTVVAYSWTNTSTRFLYNADYARLKNVTLSYNMPSEWMKAIGLRGAKVFLQGENLLTISPYEGFDPEQAVSGTTYYRYPQMRTFSIGVNVKL